MYAKLSLRNARRSAGDYLLYMITLIVLSALMMFSNFLAAASGQKGLQASSLPLLISLVMVSILSYINGYMLRCRAKEFATYILLGMKKSRIAAVFFGESLLLGTVGLAAGIAMGGLLFPLALSFLRSSFSVGNHILSACGAAVRDTVLYFVAVQMVSLLGCVRKIGRLQIRALLFEGRKNQIMKSKPRPAFWIVLCAVCLFADSVCIALATGGNGMLMSFGINFISTSFMVGIWAFYKAAFHLLAWLRTNRHRELYQGNRLYLAGRLLSRVTSNVMLNTVLSICLLFSIMTFSVGFIMPNIPKDMFAKEVGLWMSFVEICMCIVFITIYFSVLAVRQVIEAKENKLAFGMLAYLGKKSCERKGLVKQEIALKYALPAVMCFIILLLCVGPVNSYLNTFLLANNVLLIAVGYFAGCFFLMFAGYGIVAYRLCIKRLTQG